MPNQPRTITPFESLENLTKKAAQPVKQVVSDVISDVVESLGGSPVSASGSVPVQKSNVTEIDTGKISANERKKLGQIRQNLVRINLEMAEARKKREQKWVEQNKQQEQVKQVKKVEEKKKESVLAKMLKSREGTKESMARAPG